MRRYEKKMHNEFYVFDIYSSKERDAKKIAEVELHYEDEKLRRIIVSLSWMPKNAIQISSNEELKSLLTLSQEIQDLFSVTGLPLFEK